MNKLSEIVITDVEEAFVVNASSGKHINIESRKWYGISFCKSGKITYIHNNTKTVSTPDVAVILPMNESYELYNNEGGEFPLINFYCENNSFTDKFISVPINNINSYLKDFEKIRNYMLTKENRLKTISILYNIFHELSLELQDSTGILNDAKKYICKNIGSYELSNESVAEHLGISEVYFRKLFKKNNITPKQFILDMRLDMAKQLISQTNESVTNISEQCGFSNVYHFCRIFKEKTGYTPLNYRNTHRLIGI